MSTVAEHPVTLAPEVADFCRRAVEALRAKLPVREVWLFGSHAEGRANEHSDVDLFVVLPDDHGLRQPSLACRRAVSDLRERQPLDMIALAESQWRDEAVRKFSIYGDISEKGVRLL